MKRILLTVIAVLALAGCLSTHLPPEKNQYQEIVDVTGAKDVYKKTLMWAAEAFKSANDVIQYKDENGVILKGFIDKSNFLGTVQFWFTLKIDIKDEKARMTFKDMYAISGPDRIRVEMTEGGVQAFSVDAKKIIAEYKAYVEKETTDTW